MSSKRLNYHLVQSSLYLSGMPDLLGIKDPPYLWVLGVHNTRHPEET